MNVIQRITKSSYYMKCESNEGTHYATEITCTIQILGTGGFIPQATAPNPTFMAAQRPRGGPANL